MSSCSKLNFYSRREARRETRKHHYRTGGHMNTYWCDGCVAWHIGHLGAEVIAGWKSRSEAYGRAAA